MGLLHLPALPFGSSCSAAFVVQLLCELGCSLQTLLMTHLAAKLALSPPGPNTSHFELSNSKLGCEFGPTFD